MKLKNYSAMSSYINKKSDYTYSYSIYLHFGDSLLSRRYICPSNMNHLAALLLLSIVSCYGNCFLHFIKAGMFNLTRRLHMSSPIVKLLPARISSQVNEKFKNPLFLVMKLSLVLIPCAGVMYI